MTRDNRKLPAVRPGANYEVGYGKPPVASRFQPGKSGNPGGRPRGAKNKRPGLNEERLKDIILDEAYREISVRDGARMVSIPMAQAIVRALAVNAAKGQHRAQRLFAEMLSRTESQNNALSDEWLETAITYKIEWERELERRERLGITDLPPPLPHPDHVIIDLRAGTARVRGPSTKEELAQVEFFQQRREDFAAELEEMQEHLETETDEGIRTIIEDDIRHTKKVLGIIDNALERVGY
jgi:hypothetical protein